MKPHRIKITYKTFDKFKSEYDRHLSTGRLFVKASRPLPDGSLVEVVLTIPNRADPLIITGKVSRAVSEESFENGASRGFSVAFTDFNDAKMEMDRLISAPLAAENTPEPPETETTRDDDQQGDSDLEEDDDDHEPEILASKIRAMSVKDKMILAPKAKKNERAILIRDGNSSVMRMIIRNPRIGDSEIARIARDVSTPADVLDKITKNRKWMQNQEVRLAIVKNPRTPTPLALRQLPFLPPKDISALAKSQHVKDSIKREALKLVLKRFEQK
ncbi:MAG: hypothetical protein JW885_01675 [Deltaproteobacteria bacterium]|nr:hypothetical protein [Candidatus Zymogenaceae bacterium]